MGLELSVAGRDGRGTIRIANVPIDVKHKPKYDQEPQSKEIQLEPGW